MMTGQNLEVLRCDDEMILSIMLAMFYICSSLIKYYILIDIEYLQSWTALR